MIPPFWLLQKNKKLNVDMSDGEIEFLNYENGSFLGFIFLSWVLGLLTYVIISTIAFHAVLSVEVGNIIIDWLLNNFWYGMLIMLAIGLVINIIGYIIFRIRKRNTPEVESEGKTIQKITFPPGVLSGFF